MNEDQFIKNLNQYLDAIIDEFNEWANEDQEFKRFDDLYSSRINKCRKNNHIIDLYKILNDLDQEIEFNLNDNNGHIFYINIYSYTSILLNNLILLINDRVKL